MVPLADIWAFPALFGKIFYTIVLPIMLLVGTGWLIQRKLGLDMVTLKRLNFYFLMPGIIFYSVITSSLSGQQVVTVIGFAVALILCVGTLTLTAAAVFKIPKNQRSAMLLTTILNNSGNYGLPLQQFAFGARGAQAASMQAFVMITQNIFTFTVGVLIAAGGRNGKSWKSNLLHVLKFPPVYAVVAGLIFVQVGRWMSQEQSAALGEWLTPFWKYLIYVKDTFIGIALVTLGAQLALIKRGAVKYPVALSVAFRLVLGPAVGLIIIHVFDAVFGISGFTARMLMVASSTPTAVNCMLLTLEFDNHPEYTAKAVFWSTMLSPITVTAVVFLTKVQLFPVFSMT
ncbi:MAG: AEC family transporter [Phycisphaerae bacterium]